VSLRPPAFSSSLGLREVAASTMAHNITLTIATLEVVDVPSARGETTIAMSIVVLASALQRDEAQRAQK